MEEDEDENFTINEDAVEIDIAIVPPHEANGVSSDEDSDEEDVPQCNLNHIGRGCLTTECEVFGLTERSSTSSSKPEKIQWTKRAFHSPSFPATSNNLNSEAEELLSICCDPIDFFNILFPDSLIHTIVNESNHYASEKGKSINLTSDELMKVIGILYLSGYSTVPQRRLYWSSENDTRNELVATSMPRTRFENILSILHFNHIEDKNERAFKIRPLMDAVNKSFKEFIPPSDEYSIDKSMIKYFGRHPAKQCLRSKPIRFGFKMWTLCSFTGACHRFELYLGAFSFPKSPDGLGASVVLELSKDLSQGSTLYFDNYFTGISLLQKFSEKNVKATGTISRTRLRGAEKILSDVKEINKKDRGYSEAVSTDKVNVIQWKDKKTVCLASNFHSEAPLNQCRRFSTAKKKHVSVSQPNIVKCYNSGMGGVDLLDEMINAYRISIRTKKWYWCIFTWILDLVCVNAWFLYRRMNEDYMPFLKFKRSITLALLSENVRHHPRQIRPQRNSETMADCDSAVKFANPTLCTGAVCVTFPFTQNVLNSSNFR